MNCTFQVSGNSNSGKTTTLEIVVKALKKKGYMVATVKHTHDQPDVSGKDTFRFSRNGSDYSLLVSKRCVLFFSCDPEKVIQELPVDVVLVEGFKNTLYGKKKYIINSISEAKALSKTIIEDAIRCVNERN